MNELGGKRTEVVVLSKKKHNKNGLEYSLPFMNVDPLFFETEEELIDFVQKNTSRVEVVTIVDRPTHLAGLRIKIKQIKRYILFVDAIEKENIFLYFDNIKYRFFPKLKIGCAIPGAINCFFGRNKNSGHLYGIFSNIWMKKETPHSRLTMHSYSIA